MRLRSLLFAPASSPDVLRKLPRSAPDGVVLDLEDAVAPAAKPEARDHARTVAEELRAEHPDLVVLVRVNALPTEFFAADISDGLSDSLTGIIVPKLESPDQVARAADALADAGVGHLGIVAGIETVAGVEDAKAILSAGPVAAYFGAEDYTADLGGIRTAGGNEVLYARSRVAIHARLAGVPVLDQVVVDLTDDDGFVVDARAGRALGYSGKLCIHPSQVPLANQVFSPSPDEVHHARRLLAAYDEAIERGAGAIAFEGQMIDEPLARRARALLAAQPDT